MFSAQHNDGLDHLRGEPSPPPRFSIAEILFGMFAAALVMTAGRYAGYTAACSAAGFLAAFLVRWRMPEVSLLEAWAFFLHQLAWMLLFVLGAIDAEVWYPLPLTFGWFPLICLVLAAVLCANLAMATLSLIERRRYVFVWYTFVPLAWCGLASMHILFQASYGT
jgi:hypothetical protein